MRRAASSIDAYELVRLVPPFGVLAVWTVMMFISGGFDPGTWLPAGIVMAGLLTVSMVGQRQLLPPPGGARKALLVLVAFTVWCFVSIAWSDAPGTSLQAADLLLVAVLAAWTLSLAPWRPRTAEALMVGFALAAVATCAVALISALGADDLSSRFEDFRFTPPLDYSNTTAAFGFMAAVPALVAAARPGASRTVRALGQGAATFLAGYALLPESRGSILGGLAVLIILGAAVPFRWLLLSRALVLLVTVLIAAGPVLHVYRVASAGKGGTHDALSNATLALVAATLAAIAAGALLTLAEERVVIGEHVRVRARIGALVAGALIVLAIVGAGVAKSSSISHTLHDQWRSLKHPGITYGGKRNTTGESDRLISADPLERYDYWRVSFAGFRSDPLGGMGAGGFEHRYAIDRRYPKPSRYPHNLVLKVLGDTGIVGFALILAFLGVVMAGLLRAARTRPSAERAVAAAALAVLGYFVAHGEFDWLEVYPVLLGPALAFPIMALTVNARADHLGRLAGGVVQPRRSGPGPRPTWPPRGRGLPPAALAGVGVAAIVVVLLLLGPWLSLRYRNQASDTWRKAPGVAYAELRRAADVDPLAPDPLVLEGVIALTRGDLEIARSGFNRALDREQAWLPHFGLAVVAAAEGDKATAAAQLARAHALDRIDPVLKQVAPRVLAKQPIDPAKLIHDVLVTPFLSQEKIK